MTKVQKRKKRVDLRELFKEEAPIWVKNLTGTKGSRWKKPGNVVLQVTNGNTIDPITVFPGDPICLSDITDYESLKRCADLFKSLRAKTLDLLDPDDAEKYYNKYEGRREAVEKKVEAYLTRAKEKEMPKEVTSNVATISPRMSNICLQLKHDALTEEEGLETLIESAGMFSLDDYNYLLSNGKYRSIKDWASDQMRGVDEDEFGDPDEE